MYRMIFAFCSLLFISCEKNINFPLKVSPEVLVVDASIENDKPPLVILTRSFSYFSKIEPALLANSFVHQASVFMSNGTVTHQLKEYSVPLAPGLQGWYYSNDTSQPATAFTGKLDTKYNLTIVADSTTYYSTVRIPALATFPDSVWLERAPMNPDTNKRILYIRAQDPLGLGNYVRYFTRKNQESFFPGFNSVYNDEVIDGNRYSVILPQGVNRNDLPKQDSNFFRKGDTVTLKFCNIDRSTYNFWSTWEFSQQSIGNPFAQPNKVTGNISNGALGVFAGYACWYATRIAR